MRSFPEMFGLPRLLSPLLRAALARRGREIVRLKSHYEDLDRLFGRQQVRGVIDGGAHRGETSLAFLSWFPEATLYAFEPGERSFGKLATRASADRRIKPLKVALGSSAGRQSMYVNRSEVTNSLFPRSRMAELYKPVETECIRQEEVDIVTLDDWWDAHAGPPVDIIKLDVQGFELEALRGAEKLLKSGTVAVFLEVSFTAMYEGSCLYRDVATFLENRGFDLYQLYYLRSDSSGRLLYGDALFCRPTTPPDVSVDARRDGARQDALAVKGS